MDPPPTPRAESSTLAAMQNPRSESLIWGLLCALVAFAYLQTVDFGFVSVDDLTYVGTNPAVNRGISLEGLRWAFFESHSSNWIPLTWISYMIDCSVVGAEPGALHAVNVALHALASCLLFSALLRLGRASNESPEELPHPIDPFLPSALVAALFAIHPAHVESVAWIAERKDVLSGLFFMLTLLAYAGAVRGPGHAVHMTLVVSAFTLALLSKPMVVTLPFVLLLLDFWPLRRLRITRGKTLRAVWVRAITEKLPLLALAAVASGITFAVQQSGGAVQTLETIPLSERLANVPISFVRYLGLLCWPVDLAFLYPRLGPAELAWGGPVIASTVLLAGLSTGSILLRHRQPHLLVGWLWFLGTLVPVIGLVQVGEQSIADRSTYLPGIGLFIAAVWSVASWVRGPTRRAIATVASAAALIGMTGATRLQVAHWQDSISLWSHSVAVTRDNATAHDQLGRALFEARRLPEALVHHRRAVALQPDSARNRHNLANALLATGSVAEASAEWRALLGRDPDLATAHFGLASALAQERDLPEALDHFERAFAISPALLRHRATRSAWAEALRSLVDRKETDFDAAVDRYRRALALRPEWRALQTELVWLLATDPRAGPAHAQEALAITEGEFPLYSASALANTRRLEARAASLAAVGRFPDAVAAAELALEAARGSGERARADALEARIADYRAEKRSVERQVTP